MPGIGTLSGSVKTTFQYQGENQQTGAVYSPLTSSTTIPKSLSLSNTVANNVANGADECFSFQQGIAAAGSATLDLTAMTNIMQQTSVSIARLKAYQMRLLSATDDATITPAPTSTSTVTVTNIGPATPAPLGFTSRGSGLTVTLTASGAVTAVAIGAAGSGYPPSTKFFASPQQVGGSGCVFMVTTNSSGVPTAVTFITGAGGAGYTGATVPTVEVGQFSLYTGGMKLYADPSPAGFALVSSTAKNLLIYNNDGTHAVTLELDFWGGTT
jgi:hypothetical protein